MQGVPDPPGGIVMPRVTVSITCAVTESTAAAVVLDGQS